MFFACVRQVVHHSKRIIYHLKTAVFSSFFVVNLKKLRKTGSWRLWEFENRAKQEFISHSVYVSPKAESCISGLSGWKTKRSFGQTTSVISVKDSRISETTKDCVFDLIHDWLVFHVLWVSRLRRDLLIVILYFGLSIDSFCKSSSFPFVVHWMSLEEE